MFSKIMKRLAITLAVVLLVVVGAMEVNYRQGERWATEAFARLSVQVMGDIGTTDRLTILPLMDYHSSDPQLATEVGLSYLVDTDDHRILYDVGQNARGESPSPLQRNMATLGVDLASIDTVFISHNHLDHVGGMHWQRQQTFSLGKEQEPFPNPGTRLIAPASMTYPGLFSAYADRPMQLGQGVSSTGLASTGTIGRQLSIGWIEEHALVVVVEGLGGVLIVGCGHQTLPRLLQRYDDAFEQPLYGVVGGLHFPVPEGRIRLGPLDVQRRLASGGGLFNPLTMEEVDAMIAMLKARNLGLVAVSAHDSSDEVIEKIRLAMPQAHRYLKVGEPLVIGQ